MGKSGVHCVAVKLQYVLQCVTSRSGCSIISLSRRLWCKMEAAVCVAVCDAVCVAVCVAVRNAACVAVCVALHVAVRHLEKLL